MAVNDSNRTVLTVPAACLLLSFVLVTGCSRSQDDKTAQAAPRPQQAGQPMNPVATAARIAAFDATALVGDQHATKAQMQSMQKDMLRSMKIADPSRQIDHEAARVALRSLAGVRSTVWIDRENLLVVVGGANYRSMDTIDRVCLALEPLGDTLAVVVNVQDMTATTSEGADTLSRNCQLQPGERAFLQRKRQVDVLDPEMLRTFKAQQSGAPKH
jgi:hypothetical protein